MKKGIILEIKRDMLVMITQDGEFLKGIKQPDQQYAVGDEIPFFPMSNERRASKPLITWNWKVSTALLTAMIVIFSLFSSAFLQSNQAYAYVSVDINPSIELTLNNKQEVIALTPFNEDAKSLLRKLKDWEEQDVSQVTEEILLLCKEMGYLKDNQHVLITSSFVEDSNRQLEGDLTKELTKFVQKYSTDHNMNITVKETSKEMRQAATDKGMTAGSLLKGTEKAESKESAGKRESKPTVEKENVQEADKKEDSMAEENIQKPVHPESSPENDRTHKKENKQPKAQEKPAHPHSTGPDKRTETNGRQDDSDEPGQHQKQNQSNGHGNGHESKQNEKKNGHHNQQNNDDQSEKEKSKKDKKD
ncbi:anti-sigma factor domain-containing protein [Rossellomorea sp. AcN35-11]|nr:anti-sigma factor domain-containing protein [Rossellomorea aquimaris]WJV29130.1 anti-sigma factor domain-containing protein [Rossellomorea sp. AcN35-11]